ncbi:MAG TPA: carboxypeptidase-like regulatory domain-containing protein, partial [Candidatus Woesebacteria bacterium]|nr:carboxypeptidase-like regulatory domain-containing protein [Candidatus Woesebacteria bacterium]
GWFEYPEITREEHTEGIRQFILQNPDLFADGDVFTSCPECENGGPGDPRQTGNVEEYRTFLIQEYEVSKQAFAEINKNVTANYYSMNGDVAKLVMNKSTTKALDGIITVDHYVETVDQLIADINEYQKSSGGKVVLGEWGAPIPDIHGSMTQEEQAQWLDEALLRILHETDIEGLNYWTHQGSSTALWNNDNEPRQAVTVLAKYFNPRHISGDIKDTKGNILTDVHITTPNKASDVTHGTYVLPLLDAETITFSKAGYKPVTIQPDMSGTEHITQDIILISENTNLWQKIMDYFYILFHGSGLVYATINA